MGKIYCNIINMYEFQVPITNPGTWSKIYFFNLVAHLLMISQIV